MTNGTPFLIVGDGPQEPTGLGRIARDLGGLLAGSNLEIDVVQLGGTVPPVWTAWRHFPINPENDDWGASQVSAFYTDLWKDRPGILFCIWDPARLYSYVDLPIPVQKWAYTAIDSVNAQGTIGGPARVALERFDRILGYGRWGATVLKTICGPTPYLPHGISTSVLSEPWLNEDRFVTSQLGQYFRPNMTLIGCVAANQPRKDLSLFIGTLAELKARGRNVYGWLHTDTLVKAWSIPQLVEDFGLAHRVTVTGLDNPLTDQHLAALYRACDITIAPGLGEGFCYPLVESLGCGVPVIHGDFGGGAELVPTTAWRVPVRETRFESVYAMLRPVFRIQDWANATERALRWREDVGKDTAAAYCRGAVAHLDWGLLAPRWKAWITQGLEGR